MVDERISPVDFDEDVDLVGITAMTPLATRAYEIADEFKRTGQDGCDGRHARVSPPG